MNKIYENTKMENLLSKVDEDLENEFFENNEFENDYNNLIGNFENYEAFIYKFSFYPGYKLILETYDHFSYWRNSINDGDSFYRMFIFSLLENYITNKNIQELEILISEILNKKFCKLYKKENIDDILIKDIFSIILNYLKNDEIKEAYEFLLKVYKLKNQMFDKAMIIYLKSIVFHYLTAISKFLKKEPNEKYKILRGQLSNLESVKENGIDPSIIVIYLMDYLFKINMKIFIMDGLINRYNNHLITFDGNNNYPIIFIGYFFSGYTILYNYNEINDIIKTEIRKSNIKLKKLTYILDDKKICKVCHNETNNIIFLEKKLICCQNCLNEYKEEIIKKRISNLKEDSFNGLEYYSRRIHLENNLYLDNDEFIELYDNNILGLMFLKMACVCNKCKKQLNSNNTKLFCLKCGCRYCKKCLNDKINESTKYLRYINQYEKKTFEKFLCNCGKDFDPIEAMTIFESNNHYRNNDDQIKKKNAKERMKNYIVTLCMSCLRNVLEIVKNKNEEIKLEKITNFKIINIVQENGNNKGILFNDEPHKICLECFNKQKLIQEIVNKDNINEIDTQRLDTQENIINTTKTEDNKKEKKKFIKHQNKIQCNICDKIHTMKLNDLNEEGECCCNIF